MVGASGLIAGVPAGFSEDSPGGLRAGPGWPDEGAGASDGPLGADTRGAGAAGWAARGLSPAGATAGAGATLVGAAGRAWVGEVDVRDPPPGTRAGDW
jgi:hypothetical protein